jgi:hypothetical protein
MFFNNGFEDSDHSEQIQSLIFDNFILTAWVVFIGTVVWLGTVKTI